MTSPLRSSDRGSASPRSTPLRQQPNGHHRPNGYHRANRFSLEDSPSRQLIEEFGRMLVNDDRAFRQSLDEQTATQQKLHLQALDHALSRHNEVRESAERARERAELDIERERRRREDEEKKAIEKARREIEEQKLAEQRRQLEESKARDEQQRKRDALSREQEEAKRNAETRRQRDAEESRRQSEVRKQQEADELRKSNQANAERAEAARRESEANQRQNQQVQNGSQNAVRQPTSNQPNGVASLSRPAQPSAPVSGAVQQSSQMPADVPPGVISTVQEREATHNRYLDVHKRLKTMRSQVADQVKMMPVVNGQTSLKEQLSNWRRAIQKCCGQYGKGTSEEVKASNRRAINEIVQHLDAAANISEPSIDVTQYLVQNHQPPGANTQGPAVLVFLLNHFAKSIVNQFVSEAAVDSKSADATGVLAVTIFARPQYLFNGQSLIDILWAKYHKKCPVLFGISGPESTKQGRARLGWQIEGGAFVREQEHYDRMLGLGAGFAAISLRDFSKSKNSNPAPNRIYWEALARILNTPANEVQPTHFVVLKAIIDNYIPRIIATFGGAGLAALRQALITFPNERGPADEKGRKIPAVTALQAMPMMLQRDLNLTL